MKVNAGWLVGSALLIALAACRFDLPMVSDKCGDGVIDLEEGEACDDGNKLDGDGCNANCIAEGCGNLFIEPDEECDEGLEDSPSCNSGCTLVRCGDSYVNQAAGEECDTAGPNTDDCNGPLCRISVCGDSFYNPVAGEQCDAGGNAAQCNGGDNVNGLGNCQIPRCGDGYTNPSYAPPGGKLEQCDVGGNAATCNGNDNASGSGNCQIPSCGDGYRNPNFRPPGGVGAFEQCDAGGNVASCNGNDNQDGRGNCQLPSCGDGYVNPAAGEICDKGGPGIPQRGCSAGKMCNSACSACL